MEKVMLLNLLKTMVQWFLRIKKKAAEEPKTGTGVKILTPKQLLQRLPMALAQVVPAENLLNYIRQIVYSLYKSKEITKRVYNNIIKPIWL